MGSERDFALVAPGAEGYERDHPHAEHIQILDADEGRLGWTRQKIAICGFASSTRQYIPVDDPTWTIFTLNQLYRHIPRSDVHVDIHGHWEEGNVEGTDHPRWLRECGIPVLMTARVPEIPTSVRYPIERLIEKHKIDYFTSTVAFEIAFALDLIDTAVAARTKALSAEGMSVHDAYLLTRSIYREYSVMIAGVDLIVASEYFFQKPCAEFWLGELESRDIHLVMPPETALLKHAYRYGYEREVQVGLIALSEYEQRLVALEKRKTDALAIMQALSGAAQELTRLKDQPAWPSRQELEERLKLVLTDRERAISLAQTLDGAYQESKHLHDVLELRSRGGQIPLGG